MLIDRNMSGPAEWVAAALQDAPPLVPNDSSVLEDGARRQTAANPQSDAPTSRGKTLSQWPGGPGRAMIVGEPSSGRNLVHSAIPLPDGSETLILATGLWERPNARRRLTDTVDKPDPRVFRSPDAPPVWRVVPDIAVGPQNSK